ncbi:MAG: flagellar biosynthetic protein FliO [Ancalomicrobiaceae bacterium]|nr:flagellar biosynthetic protein FliO [Ancalomicrobiaceae bacterium]
MREWLNSILGQDAGQVAQFVIALVLVVILIVLVAWVIGRFASSSLAGRKGSTKGRSRLAVTDASDVDGHRRLVLVRRDDVEHLIMIGGPNDLLIESRIVRQPTTAGRPNPQQMPRTSAPSPQELLSAAAPPAALVPPAAQPAPAPSLAQQRVPTQPPRHEALDDSAPTQLAQPAEPPVPRRPDLRPPTLNSLLHAAASVAATPPATTPPPSHTAPPSHAAPQHRAAPAFEPPRPPQVATSRTLPPLHRYDDREGPTEIVPPARPAVEAPTPFAVEQKSRVSNQIEQALSGLAPEPAPMPRPVVSEQAQPRQTRFESVSSQQPALQEFEASVLMPATPAAPQHETTAPARPLMPPIPPRPTPVPRASQSAPVAAPQSVRAAAEPDAATPEPDTIAFVPRPALVMPLPQAPRPQPTQPVAAPRPLTAMPFPGPAAATPLSAPLGEPKSEQKQKSDELEEEMAKLLSELGRPPSR